MARKNPFNLVGIADLLVVECSRWSRILPQCSPLPGGAPINAWLRGLLSLQIGRELQREGMIRDGDVREGIMAISAVGGALKMDPTKYLNQVSVNELIRQSAGAAAVALDDISVPVEVDICTITNAWPADFPVQPVSNIISFDPAHWAAWLLTLVPGSTGLVATCQASNAPAGIKPVPVNGELHPWAVAMYIDVNIVTGAAMKQRVEDDLAILELLLIIALFSRRSAARHGQIINLIVLGITIVTSGGHITNGQIRKIIKQSNVDTVDFTREMVLKGWDFFSMHCLHGMTTGDDFRQLFQLLEATARPISLCLASLCQQTELKMLTPIVTTVRAIKDFQDFPWQELFDLIVLQTGTDELGPIQQYGAYIATPPSAPQPVSTAVTDAPPGGHWAGWELIQRERPQGHMKISSFVNSLYAAIQLTIQVGGNMALRQYKVLQNHTVPLKDIIDNWIVRYVQARAVARGVAAVSPAVAASAGLQAIRALHL
ncbi:uncharacterized protein [Phyllobates terribilis]|uniref:uncharacterized protein n=1 Tax=Phyllobates terribilis TaxID=111132 RepID=UPI003CCA9C7A